jgi:uncharacterized membrane protein HdeD (DUF308 family)
MAERGALCLLIGIVVLVGPRFMQSSGWHDMVAGAALVGWFALVLGAALIVADLLQRARAKRR